MDANAIPSDWCHASIREFPKVNVAIATNVLSDSSYYSSFKPSSIQDILNEEVVAIIQDWKEKVSNDFKFMQLRQTRFHYPFFYLMGWPCRLVGAGGDAFKFAFHRYSSP